MQFNLHSLLAVSLCLIPPTLVFFRILRKRREQRQSGQHPFKELRRRPAGEALRMKLSDLYDQGVTGIFGLVFFPMTLGLQLLYIHPNDVITPILFFAATVATSVIFGIWMFKIEKLISAYRLGFDGERFVGEELSQLIALGFQVYHDVPFDGFNLDHVLVGSRGVLVVETKARRKPAKHNGGKEFRVGFDGKSLQWPWGSDSRAVEQTKNNARTLANWLSAATGEKVWATAILTVPGWMVDRKAPSHDIYVLNPKEIYGVCSSFAEKLTDKQIACLCHQLDQKCRIVVED